MSANLNLTRNPETEAFQYAFITGPGRSGTTWLGQILNTYEHCIYKYEPFLPIKSSPYKEWQKDLETGDPEELRERFQDLCSHCYHEVDLPPFPPKSFRQQNPKLLYLLYGLGKKSSLLKPLYEQYGRVPVTENIPVLIKDVNFPNHLLPRIGEVLQPHLIAMIRNPFANIASYFKGVELDLFNQPTQEEQVIQLRQSLELPMGQLFQQNQEQLSEMSLAQLAAVRWRFQVEPLVDYANKYDQSFVVVYEDLCADPHAKTSEIFNFLGWELSQSTRDFIDQSISGERQFSKSSKSYYSVYRDPRKSLSKWKTQLTDEQKKDIASIIIDSPLKNLWSDIPL